MGVYRFAGVKRTPKAKAEECCEPVCGPTTCGTSVEAKDESKTKVKDQCCEPECGPTTCS